MTEDINELYNMVKLPSAFKKYSIGITPHLPIITDKNIQDGFITRYFCKYISSNSIEITEVDEQTYKKIQKNPLYQTISLMWKIVGKKYDYVINSDCCSNKLLLIITEDGKRLSLTPAEFGARAGSPNDVILDRDEYIIGFGVQTENRKIVEFADLTMVGIRRYLTNYTDFWQGE